jgi:dCMP deaminase
VMDGTKAKLKKERYESLYIDIAERIAKMSHAKRLQVGSVLVKDDCIISYGWNGMPSGFDNNCEDKVYANEWSIDNNTWEYQEEDGGHPYNLKTKPEVLHSEANCLMKVARSTNSSEGASLFVTHAPCIDCAKLIHQSGINSVYYRNSYRDELGINFLKQCKVEVTKV